MRNGRESRKVTRNEKNEAGVGAGLTPSAKGEDAIDATAVLSAEEGSNLGVASKKLKVVLEVHCLASDAASNHLGSLHELNRDYALSGKMSMVSADFLYNPGSARGQNSCVHELFAKNNIEDAVSFTNTVMAPRAHRRILCSNSTFIH